MLPTVPIPCPMGYMSVWDLILNNPEWVSALAHWMLVALTGFILVKHGKHLFGIQGAIQAAANASLEVEPVCIPSESFVPTPPSSEYWEAIKALGSPAEVAFGVHPKDLQEKIQEVIDAKNVVETPPVKKSHYHMVVTDEFGKLLTSPTVAVSAGDASWPRVGDTMQPEGWLVKGVTEKAVPDYCRQPVTCAGEFHVNVQKWGVGDLFWLGQDLGWTRGMIQAGDVDASRHGFTQILFHAERLKLKQESSLREHWTKLATWNHKLGTAYHNLQDSRVKETIIKNLDDATTAIGAFIHKHQPGFVSDQDVFNAVVEGLGAKLSEFMTNPNALCQCDDFDPVVTENGTVRCRKCGR